MNAQSVSEIRKQWIGKTWPVWWDTNDCRPAGEHRGTILEVLPYTGRYDFIACIFRLSAPNNSKGWAEMSIEHINLRHAQADPPDDENEEFQRMDHERHNHLPIER